MEKEYPVILPILTLNLQAESKKISLNIFALTLAGTWGEVDASPWGFSRITRVKSGLSQRNFQYPRVNRFTPTLKIWWSWPKWPLICDLTVICHFSRQWLAGILIRRMSARIRRAFAVFSWFQTFKHVIWRWSHALGWVEKSPKGQVRSLTFDDLGSLFRFAHVSRLVF